MKKIAWIVLPIFLGCSSVRIPQYIQDKHPYKKTFYASFEETLGATHRTLEQMGWTIAIETDPSVYERHPILNEGGGRAVLIMTEIRSTPFFVGSRYARLNFYLRGAEHVTETEIRYLTINSLAVKSFNNYRNDAAVERIFARIEEELK